MFARSGMGRCSLCASKLLLKTKNIGGLNNRKLTNGVYGIAIVKDATDLSSKSRLHATWKRSEHAVIVPRVVQ